MKKIFKNLLYVFSSIFFLILFTSCVDKQKKVEIDKEEFLVEDFETIDDSNDVLEGSPIVDNENTNIVIEDVSNIVIEDAKNENPNNYKIEISEDNTYVLESINYNSSGSILGNSYVQISEADNNFVSIRYIFEIKSLDCNLSLIRTMYPYGSNAAFKAEKVYEIDAVCSGYYVGSELHKEDNTWYVLYTMRNVPYDYWEYELDVDLKVFELGTTTLTEETNLKKNALSVIYDNGSEANYFNSDYSINEVIEGGCSLNYLGNDNFIEIPNKFPYEDNGNYHYLNVLELNQALKPTEIIIPSSVVAVNSLNNNVVIYYKGSSSDDVLNNNDYTIYAYNASYDLSCWYYKNNMPKLWSDSVLITEVVGANESAMVSFNIAKNKSYNVYYSTNGIDFSDAIDEKLIFIDSTNNTATAYILGLSAGNYYIKVELDEDSTEYQISDAITVSAQDRSGYAHFNYNEGVGAYNDDGTLKENADVIYVTNDNKNTVTYGGQTGLVNILMNLSSVSNPVCIRFLDMIETTQWDSITYTQEAKSSELAAAVVASYNGAESVGGKYYAASLLEKKANSYSTDLAAGITTLDNLVSWGSSTDSYWNMCDISNAQNITLEGVGLNAGLYQWGITWKNCKSIEVKNLTFDKYTEDACAIEGSTSSADLSSYANLGRYWIHNNTFYKGYNRWDVSDDQDKADGDGATDIKRTAYATYSYNHYIENHKTGLVSNADDTYTACITFHHNFYEECESRLPLARNANMHMYNNYYYGSTGTNMSIRARGYAFIENCVFDSCKNPVETKSGNGYTGVVKSYNNTFTNCTNANNATIVTNRYEEVTNSNSYLSDFGYSFDVDPIIFYYDYVNKKSDVKNMISINDVSSTVSAYAGAGNNYYKSLNLENDTNEYHTVTFKKYVDDNETVLFTYKVLDGETITSPIDDYRVYGYAAETWFTSTNFNQKFDFNTEITSDLTLYAKYTELQSYTISYKYNIGEEDVLINSVDYYEDVKVSQPLDPTLSGYSFQGWYTDTNYGTEYEFGNYLSEDITVYAKFEVYTGEYGYEIRFDSLDDGTISSNTNITNATILATSENNKTVSINTASGTFPAGYTATKCLNLGGAGDTSKRSISFVLEQDANITVLYYGNGEERPLALKNATDEVTENCSASGIKVHTFENNPAGTYYLYSKNKGITIYLIVVESGASSQSGSEDPVVPDNLTLNMYRIARAYPNTSYNNGVYKPYYVKTIYKEGSEFDSSNITAYADDTFVDTGLTATGFSSAVGNHTITVEYLGLNAEYTVYVLEDSEYYNVAVGKNYSIGDTTTINNETYITFKTIEQALEYLRDFTSPTLGNRATLYIEKGVYREKIDIDIPYLTIIGEGRTNATYISDENYDADSYNNATIIEWDSLYGVVENGFTNITDSTQTVGIRQSAAYCEIKNLTISNANNCYSYFTNVVNSQSEHRALALLVQSDHLVIDNCSLLGYQDTVEFFTGRSYISNSYISGTTDYIFGTNATVYFKNSTIHTIYNGYYDYGGMVSAFKGNNGVIEGVSNSPIEYGAIFDGCIFEADSLVNDGTVSLGRPWSVDSATMIMNSTISAAYSTLAYSNNDTYGKRYVSMSGRNPDNSNGENVRFFEYNNNGLGAISTSVNGCQVLNSDAADAYGDLSTVFGRNNGSVEYNDVWDGTIPTVDTNVYYYFDRVGTASGNSYYWNQSVEGSSANLGNMTIDATSGKFAYNDAAGYTQMNQGTKLILTVDSDCTIIITSYSGQYNYKVIVDAVETPANANEFSFDVAAGKTVTIEATSTAYLYSLTISI